MLRFLRPLFAFLTVSLISIAMEHSTYSEREVAGERRVSGEYVCTFYARDHFFKFYGYGSSVTQACNAAYEKCWRHYRDACRYDTHWEKFR